jgi:hypothetical protein
MGGKILTCAPRAAGDLERVTNLGPIVRRRYGSGGSAQAVFAKLQFVREVEDEGREPGRTEAARALQAAALVRVVDGLATVVRRRRKTMGVLGQKSSLSVEVESVPEDFVEPPVTEMATFAADMDDHVDDAEAPTEHTPLLLPFRSPISASSSSPPNGPVPSTSAPASTTTTTTTTTTTATTTTTITADDNTLPLPHAATASRHRLTLGRLLKRPLALLSDALAAAKATARRVGMALWAAFVAVPLMLVRAAVALVVAMLVRLLLVPVEGAAVILSL